MDPHILNGLTPQQLRDKILESSTGFSVEDDGIQYLGREIQLKAGKAIVSDSEQNRSQPESKALLGRLVSIQPDLRGQLASSRAEALQQTAEEMVKKWSDRAVQKSPTQALKFATALEYIGSEPDRIIAIQAELQRFSLPEKYQLLSAVQKKAATPLRYVSQRSLGIDPVYRFELIKEAIQLPDNSALACDSRRGESYIMGFDREKTLASGLRLMRQLLDREDSELATRLTPEVDRISKQFSSLVDSEGKLSYSDQLAFEACGNNLLYLVAACSDVSDKADIEELLSYITSVLRDNDYESIHHIARELAFLAKQPDSVGYDRYVDAVAAILAAPSFTVTEHGKLRQLTDIRGFGLLEGSKPLAAYLAALENLVKTLPREYSSVLLSEITAIERSFADKKQSDDSFTDTDRQEIKKRVHRLLLVIAACKSSVYIMDASALALFVEAIMTHGNKKNIPYLVSGLACLVRSTPEIQHSLSTAAPRGGAHCLLAPLGLLRLLSAAIISRDDLETICKQLQANNASRRRMKDGKVFHQWLVTLDHIQASTIPGKASTGRVLRALTLNMSTIYETLGLLDMVIMAEKGGGQALQLLGLGQCRAENALLLLAEKGLAWISQDRQPVSQWLLRQRYPHLLPVYLQKIIEAEERYIPPKEKTELIRLIHQFVESSASNTFIEARQSPLNNPHLQAVYQKWPEFSAGWGRNFNGFSQNIRGRLGAGEVLVLTEDPWDLFVSGLEIKSCLSPDKGVWHTKALMGYVMDGRNAMIVIKNKKGNILSRAVIRMMLDKSFKPALFIEWPYPFNLDNASLFMDAALEIAQHMRLPLYQDGSLQDQEETLTMLAGRAPFDNFNSIIGVRAREDKIHFQGVEVKPGQG